MELAIVLVAVVVTVFAGSSVATRIGVPAPLLLTVLGVVIAFTPFIPDLEISADLVLVGLLPPLLYAAAIRTSLLDFRTNWRGIALLSVGLVVFTTLGVGVVAHWLLPIPWAAAFALGAVVAPPDAVAATAIARRVRMPRRIVTILEGESLVNDATALVCLRTAIAALGTAGAAADGALDSDDVRAALTVAGSFVWAAGGGVLIGLAVAAVLVQVRRRLTDTVSDTTVSLVAPWLAYLPAEELHVGEIPASGVLAVVVTGLVLGHKAPVVQSAASRISERTYWRTLAHLLENAVFLLIGLQAFRIVSDVRASELSTATVVLACLGVFVAAVLLRPVWVLPVTYLPGVVAAPTRPRDFSWRYPVVVSWAGMRGVVTLAAVFTLPSDTPHREVLVLIALVVTAGTLLLQGSTLPWLVRWLGLHGPDPMEDRLQEATVLHGASAAGLRVLDAQAPPGDPDGVADFLRTQTERRAHFAWERLGRASAAADSPLETARRLRRAMLDAERQEVLRLRDAGTVPHEILQQVLGVLDVEESVLAGADDRDDDVREGGDGLVPELPGGGCDHLDSAPTTAVPVTPGECGDCLAEGSSSWVHLRMCLTCGQVGCCDSSPQRHAARHFSSTHDPVMRSVEPGEAWRWCYVHEMAG